MNSRLATSKSQRPRTQSRGDDRRRKLLQAAKRLLNKKDVLDLSFTDVCAAAGVPPSSARYFYPDINALLSTLIVETTKEHDAALMRPMRPKDLQSWRAMVGCVIERTAQFHRSHPNFSKLTISGKTLPDLKRLDRAANRMRSGNVLAAIGEYFVLPRSTDLADAAYLAAEIVDLSFTLSMNESGRVTDKWVGFAKTAVNQLLCHYFGGELMPRPVAAAPRLPETRASVSKTRGTASSK